MASNPKFIKAEYIDLPKDVIEPSNGLSMDFGGSVIKLVYRTKETLIKEGEPPVKEGFERLRIASYGRPYLDDALEDMAKNCNIKRGSDEAELPVIYTTGVGAHQYAQKIGEKLKIKTSNLTEFDCFVKSFKYICQVLPKKNIVDALHEKGAAEAHTLMNKLAPAINKATENSNVNYNIDMDAMNINDSSKAEGEDCEKTFSEVEKNLFPCLIIMMGSGFGIMKVNPDGTFLTLDGSNRGGRSFLGLGSLLTRAKSYEELIKYAEEGDSTKVDTYSQDLKINQDGDDVYAQTPDDMLVFCFGKTPGHKLSDYNKADLARALVVQYCTDIAQMVHMTAAISNVSNVFFCGNFATPDVIRMELTKYLEFRKMTRMFAKNPIKFNFLTHGGHLGALGAFLNDSNLS